MKSNKLIFNLVIFHCFIIGISNYLVQFPVSVIGYDFTIATFTFPFIILATDLTVRLSSSSNARKIVGIAFIPAFFISLYFSDLRIAIASVSAYALAQTLDIFIFSKIRSKLGEDRLRLNTTWFLAPAISTFFAQLVDTYTFYGIAFYNSNDIFMSENWSTIATNDLIFKLIVCYAAFLPIYVLILNFAFSVLKQKKI